MSHIVATLPAKVSNSNDIKMPSIRKILFNDRQEDLFSIIFVGKPGKSTKGHFPFCSFHFF